MSHSALGADVLEGMLADDGGDVDDAADGEDEEGDDDGDEDGGEDGDEDDDEDGGDDDEDDDEGEDEGEGEEDGEEGGEGEDGEASAFASFCLKLCKFGMKRVNKSNKKRKV